MFIAWSNRIKAAQYQLIQLCGGIPGTLAVLGDSTWGRSTVGRWSDINDPTLMPLGAVIKLEKACGASVVTAALAELNNRRLADPDPELVEQACIMQRHAAAVMQAGELMASGAAAFADGRVTPNEAAEMDRAAAQLERGLAEYRKTLSGIRAQGGTSVVKDSTDNTEARRA